MKGDSTTVPHVSVVIPVKNGAEYLLRAVKSIERIALQAGLDVEVVVVDDGADLDLHQILTSGHVRIPVSIVAGRSAGPSAARNVGAAVSRGNFLTFLDVDDAVLPAWLALYESTHFLEQRGDPRAVVGRGPGLLEDAISGGRRVSNRSSWLPGCYLVSVEIFNQNSGFDECRRWGEHHELGHRIEQSPNVTVIDHDDIDPVVVKFDNRSAAVVLGYAEHLYGAASKAGSRSLTPDQVASNADFRSVALARLCDWHNAREAAFNATRSKMNVHRLMRWLVLFIPGIRYLFFHTRLKVRDSVKRTEFLMNSCQERVMRIATTVRALLFIGQD